MTDPARMQRMICALEGVAMGDAYGNHHGSNQRKRQSEQWEFSDDTLMALSIVSNLRQYGSIRQAELAQSFAVQWNGARGYGQGVTRLLKSIQRGTDWKIATTSMFDNQGSFGNGSAMRVAPLGAYFADDLSIAAEQARLSSEVTHMHPEGIAGAIAVAIAAALTWQLHVKNIAIDKPTFLSRVLEFVPLSEIHRKLQIALELPPNTMSSMAAETLGNGRPAIAQQTVPFALWAAATYMSNFETAIRKTAGVRGDVDTNCAIVGGIVVIYTGVEGIPQKWRDRREPLPAWPFEDATETP